MPSPPPSDAVKIFLSYAREDFDAVSAIYDRLEALGLKPWMDKYDILPGERWELKLSEAIRESHFFLAFLSAKSVAKRGYLHREFKQALDLWQEKLDSDIYLIPVRLDKCQVPETLRALQWADLYEEDAWWALLRAIRAGAERLGLSIPQALHEVPKRGRSVPRGSTAPPARDVPSAEAKPVPEIQVVQPIQSARPDLLVIDKLVYLELVRIPAGDFLMGDDKTSTPMTEFYIGKYPITNVQYAAFVQATGHKHPEHWKGGQIPVGKENHPVVHVSWDDAVAFCEWMSEATGRKLRLPSEAEWEKAARGTDGREYPWGNVSPSKDNKFCNFRDTGIGDTTPVGKFPEGASPYGLLDMAGNVSVWTSSWYDNRKSYRVVRGGSFRGYARGAQCAYRNYNSPDSRGDSVGLRVCMSPGI